MTGLVKKILVEGVVQGVGFRPFIYNLARTYNISGFVRNTKAGVEIEAVGQENDLERFVSDITKNPPSLAKIKQVIVKDLCRTEGGHPIYAKEFSIVNSFSSEEKSIFLSPDASICGDCKDDFYNEKGRYYRYPFVNCTNCGPRFSIIEAYPYDRINTTMRKFTMCNNCRAEYTDINSRRYHAEPISCKDCGPIYRMMDNSFKEITTDNLFETVRYLIKIGSIIAMKGIGGYHLVCDGENKNAVKKLRQRKLRDTKPFAVMLKDIDIVKKYCYCSIEEENVLKGKESPVVLLKQKSGVMCDDMRFLISGSSPNLGVMIPYAPYQYLLMEDFDILVYTSANISGEPIVYRDDELKRLTTIADYFVVHDREIVRFVEDSVVKLILYNARQIPILIRKSRGFAPSPLFLKKNSELQILGMGSDLKSTISFIKEDVLIQSQYLGDLADYLSFEDYKRTIADFKKFFVLKPDLIACDLHPSYLSSQYAELVAGEEIKILKVQHHKAHIASVALEEGWFCDDFIGIAFDGTGYGEDGAIWGSEVFAGSLKKGFERLGHLSYVALPFGDTAIKNPEKSAFSYYAFLDLLDDELLSIFSNQTKENVKELLHFVKRSPLLTSSTGRLFDAVSFLLGFRRQIGYEGEPAIELENMIYKRFSLEDDIGSYEYQLIEDSGKLLVNTGLLLKQIIQSFKSGEDFSNIAIKFHSTLVAAFIEVVKHIRDMRRLDKVALSGGSFQNSYLTYHVIKQLEKEGFQWAINRYSPTNDACVSMGQCAIAAFYSTTM